VETCSGSGEPRPGGAPTCGDERTETFREIGEIDGKDNMAALQRDMWKWMEKDNMAAFQRDTWKWLEKENMDAERARIPKIDAKRRKWTHRDGICKQLFKRECWHRYGISFNRNKDGTWTHKEIIHTNVLRIECAHAYVCVSVHPSGCKPVGVCL
jgi:hypothetical protein